MKESRNYDDIIDLPHHTSPTRPRMSATDRAAQFSPFAALTGYSEVVKETARVTEERIELDENRKAQLDEKLQQILHLIDTEPEITLTYFEKDPRKSGGAYVTHKGRVRRIDGFTRKVIFADNRSVDIDNITDITGEAVN